MIKTMLSSASDIRSCDWWRAIVDAKKSDACSHAKDAVSPDFQYSFISRMKSHTSGHPSTYSAGGTDPPSLFLVSNIFEHSSLEKYGFSALSWSILVSKTDLVKNPVFVIHDVEARDICGCKSL